MPRSFVAGGMILAILAVGCGKDRLPLYPVQGKVIDAEGHPAVGAKVIFHPQGDSDFKERPVGVVDEAGAFQLTTYEQGDGVPAGKYAVTIEWRAPRKTPVDPISPDKLKGRYANPQTTTFSATVERQPTTLEPFQVK